MKNIIQRVQEPTPRFFRKIRNMGLLLTAVSGAVLTAPVTLPAVLMTAAGYLAIAGAIASAISQTAVTDEGQP
jgi:ABC-type long-subunit fatty acid transport system fused permease/ATPase subunit